MYIIFFYYFMFYDWLKINAINMSNHKRARKESHEEQKPPWIPRSELNLLSMSVAQLKEQMRLRGIRPLTGDKATIMERFQNALKKEPMLHWRRKEVHWKSFNLVCNLCP